ncbi:MAG: hypothetical protein PHQ35_10695 [Phycisphaerae bacterium]|nr:hypothetical protein [Phycisphaerae bacterium]
MRNDFLFPVLDINWPDEALERLFEFIPPEAIVPYIKKRKEEMKEDEAWLMGKEDFFNEDGTAWEMSPGELEIFKSIVLRDNRRVQIVSSTQYGKTLTVSRGLLERITAFPEDWLVVVPDLKRGKILLNYIIKDTYNNSYFQQKLVGINLAERNALNRLLEEKSKVKLTYKVLDENDKIRYGSVEIISCEARRKQDVINSIMGFGGRNVIQEEAALEDDEVDAGIFRMLGGKGEDTCLIKIGNSFYRNHFLTSWKNPNYKKIYIDYVIGMAEGRYVESFIEEAKTKPKFDILFECRFPAEDQIDESGWSPLITQSELELALTDDFNPFGVPALGGDPSGEGDNESVIVVRWRNVAKIDFASAKIQSIDFAGEISRSIDAYKIDVRTCAVDKVGPGEMLPGKMKEIGKPVQGINVGENCDNLTDQAQFVNKRAEFAWMVRDWIKGGGKLLRDPRWYQLLNIKYKEDNKRRLKLMSKDDMRKLGIASPDAFDALCLTFARPQVFYKKSLEQDFFERKMKQQSVMKKKGDNKPFKMTSY